MFRKKMHSDRRSTGRLVWNLKRNFCNGDSVWFMFLKKIRTKFGGFASEGFVYIHLFVPLLGWIEDELHN